MLIKDRITTTTTAAWAGSVLVALAVLLATAPTLSVLQFSSSMENLNVATVLEIRRTGVWLVPTLESDSRINKPPLTAWVTTAFVPSSSVERLNEHDPAIREQAYRDVAFRIRLAAVLETCVTILLIAAIAQITIGGFAPFTAAAAYATSILVLKLGRTATTDVQMVMWIALAQLGIALSIWRGRRWTGAMIAGIATGLALMSKGPVCLLFVILPAVAFVALRAIWADRIEPIREGASDVAARLRPRGSFSRFAPILVGALLALLIGVPWYLMVYLNSPTVARGWTSEVTRFGATDNAAYHPFFYLAIFPFITPWLPWAVVGMYLAAADLRRRLATPAAWLLLAAVLPLLVMSFFPDRKDRYALPAVIPLAILVAYGINVCFAADGSRNVRRALLAIQFLTLALLALALPIAGATTLKTFDHHHWFSAGEAAGSAAVLLALIAGGLLLQRRWPLAFVGASVVVMLAAQIVFMPVYSRSDAGQSDMKPLADAIRQEVPDPQLIINGRPDRKRISVDLAIYLNRTTQHNSNWATLPLMNPPAIVLMQQFPGKPEPTPPPGWRVLAKTPRGKDALWAFVQTKN